MNSEIDTILRLDSKNWVVYTDQQNLKHDYDIYHQIIKLHNEKMQEIQPEFAVMFITKCRNKYSTVVINHVVFSLNYIISRNSIIYRIVDLFSMINTNDYYTILISPKSGSNEINNSSTIKLNLIYLCMAYLIRKHTRENKIVISYNTYIFLK